MTKRNLLKALTLAGSSAALAVGVAGSLALEVACSSGGGGGGTATGTTSGSGSSSGSSSGATTTSSGTTSGSSSGSTGVDASTTVVGPPSMTGYVSVTSLNITGAWYGYGDDLGTSGAPPGVCETTGMHMMSECSQITSPPPPMMTDAGVMGMFAPNAMGAMCLSGTGAKVINGPGSTAMPDYSNIFGIGIGLDFNNVGGLKLPYDATMNGVTGFTFDISGVPAGGIRVEFPTTDTATGIQDAYAIQVMTDGTYTANLATTGANKLSPSFTPPMGSTEPAFDASKLLSIQFHVATNKSAAITVTNMCVNNLTAIVGG